jgi:hypothetical protein
LPSDVDQDGFIVPRDALLVVNELNARSLSTTSGAFRFERPTASTGFVYLDTSGDNLVTPVDALRVINRLNGVFQPGEGELASDGSALARDSGVLASDGSALVDWPLTSVVVGASNIGPGGLGGPGGDSGFVGAVAVSEVALSPIEVSPLPFEQAPVAVGPPRASSPTVVDGPTSGDSRSDGDGPFRSRLESDQVHDAALSDQDLLASGLIDGTLPGFE